MRSWVGAGLVIVAVMTVVMAQPREAEARRGIVIYHSGEDVFPAGPLPEPFNEHPQLKGGQAGFKCSIFGLFWAYFHIWNCKPVAVKGDTYYEDSDLSKAIAAKYTESDMKVGLWTKHGRWIFLAALLGMVVIWLIGRKLPDEDEEEDADESQSQTAG